MAGSVRLAGGATGYPAVGALFTVTGGHLRAHFCTASVVDSPAGDLIVTAAHCIRGYRDASPAGLVFVPGFDNGKAPYGVWPVTRTFIDSAWASSADPGHDVAFLAIGQPGGNSSLQDITGGETLGINAPPAGIVRVIGYPDTRDQPVSCQNRSSAFSSSQMQFDCANYTDGTSGGPFLAGVNAATGEGTVIGVIGGYQLGGRTPDVSYAATFGQDVRALYHAAVSGT